MSFTVFTRDNKAHEALSFAICVDTGSTQLLSLGKVYAFLGEVPNSHDNVYVIDDRGVKQNFARARFQPYKGESSQWFHADEDRVNIQAGKLYERATNLGGRKTNPGCMWMVDETGQPTSYGKAIFTQVEPDYSAQYLACKMRSAMEKGPEALIGARVEVNVLNFKVKHEEPVRYVQVQFEEEGKLYTYKHRGEVKPGDEAVVRVENRNYPELCGTKIVEVVNVLDHNPTHFDLKWLVSVVNLDKYHARQEAEAAYKAAKRELDEEVERAMRKDMVALLAQHNPEIAAKLELLERLGKVLGL